MTGKRKTHITQFGWKVPETENPRFRMRWRDLIASCRQCSFREKMFSETSRRSLCTGAAKKDGLPGRFPGATRYATLRTTRSVRRVVKRRVDPSECIPVAEHRAPWFRSD